MSKRGRMDPKAVPEARAPEYLRPGGGDLAMVQGWGSWARAPAGASGPVLSVPSSAPRAVPLSPARSVGPSSRGRVLPAPSRMHREFAPPNVGPGFSSPTRRLAGAGIPAPGLVPKLSWAHAVSGVPRFRPHRPPPAPTHPKPHVPATAGLSLHLHAARRRLRLLLASPDRGAARWVSAQLPPLLPPPVPTTAPARSCSA